MPTDDRVPAPTPPKSPTSPGKSEKPEPIDPASLDDYAEFQQWKRAQEDDAAKAGDSERVRVFVEIPLPSTNKTLRYELLNLGEDQIAQLQMLAVFAQNDLDHMKAMFESVFGPDQYEDLAKHVRAASRDILKAHAADPENNPSLMEVWRSLTSAVIGVVEELSNDPKFNGSDTGPSPTGARSEPSSAASALPPVS